MNSGSQIYYEWATLAGVHSWWQMAALTAIVLAIIAYVVWLYRRDTVELSRPIRYSLVLLRLAAFAGLLLYFLNLQRRTETPLVQSSQVAVLVDSSLSMTLPASAAPAAAGVAGESRAEVAAAALGQGDLIERLQQDHEVTVYRIDASPTPTAVASFERTGQIEGLTVGTGQTVSPGRLRLALYAAAIIGIAAIVLLSVGMFWRSRRNRRPDREAHDAADYGVLAGTVLALLAVIIAGTVAAVGTDWNFRSLWTAQPARAAAAPTAEEREQGDASERATPTQTDWAALLAADGVATPLGDSVAAIVNRGGSTPPAGIVLITDGQSNTGLALPSAAAAAGAASIPIAAVGLGSAEDPINVRLVDVRAPRRVFPGDRFRVEATVAATSLGGRPLTVQVRRRGLGDTTDSNPVAADENATNSDDVAAAAEDGNFEIDAEQTIQLPANDALANVQFEVTPPAIGRYAYEVRLLAPAGDSNAADDAQSQDIEVIEPRATVLIIAGGPTREYQFVRNLLYRDETIQSHVLLQTGGPGMSQEADRLLETFPTTAEEMAQYECVLAFDADWLALEPEAVQTLEQWVAGGAGGLVMIAGPIDTPEWAGSAGDSDPAARLLRAMAPVELGSGGSRLVSLGRFDGETAWPLELTSAAADVDFFDVANSPELSTEAWNSFDGVYTYYNTYDLKPGASALAYFSDPSARSSGSLPIYLASQFYGGGRVVFQASGEMWRMRDVDENYFNTYWTKLVRWAAQGRLLRDSDYGFLLADKEEATLGDTVILRAVLKDRQFRPLTQASVTANVQLPGGRLTPLELSSLQASGQEGVYVGQLPLALPGKYSVRLDMRSAGGDLLTKDLVARIPTAEIQQPRRNDEVLLAAAQASGGVYYAGFDDLRTGRTFAAEGSDPDNSLRLELADALPSRDVVNYLPGAPDRQFQQRWRTALLLGIAGALSLEWLLRRLSRLA